MCYDQKPSPSRPPTPYDRQVVPTFAGRPLAAFTLPPQQDELWPEGRSTFPGESNTASKSASPPCSALRLSPALTFAFTFLALSYRPRIYCIGLRPYIELQPCIGLRSRIFCIGLQPYIGLRPRIYRIGLWPHFWASATHLASAPLLGFDPAFTSAPSLAFTAFGLQPGIYCFQVLTPRIYYFQAHVKSKIDLDSNSSKRYSEEQI
ncbi:hypothetical protein CDL15_Pgr008066 [Punica granatum]|uniref:Uncharacterized protein n=1 Tax=Punica granatum TaxID=22663 RepID=A0A218WMP0_PUNGR|nr:hypothetical protein CDL15_Pgr008066 [Punica granatum]